MLQEHKYIMLKNIKLLVMDVDGTLTDGKIYCSGQGEPFKAFNVKDGYGIAYILPQLNIVPVIITGRKSDIVEYRAKELGINELYQGVNDKKSVLEGLLQKHNCTFENVAYIGDDLNDLTCMEKCGLTACPFDAVEEVKNVVSFVCKNVGGNGAVREFIDKMFL
jgi:3-deoxy-D-manno-octulosonate 8-phosphate phosphatase (KDO 8-P phosphatase)